MNRHLGNQNEIHGVEEDESNCWKKIMLKKMAELNQIKFN